MGSTFSNYHLRTNNPKVVAEFFQGIAQLRTIICLPKNMWVTVYDEALEYKDLPEHHRVLVELTRKLATIAVFFAVHDSDESVFLLYDSGTLVDQFCSEPFRQMVLSDSPEPVVLKSCCNCSGARPQRAGT